MLTILKSVFLEFLHVIPFALITLFILIKKLNPKYILIAFLISFLIDIDHLFDLFKANSENPISSALSGEYFTKSNKLYLPFHSFEIPIILSFMGLFLQKYKNILFIISIAVLGHIVIDLISYQPNILTYSFTYRLINNFNLESFGFHN